MYIALNEKEESQAEAPRFVLLLKSVDNGVEICSEEFDKGVCRKEIKRG